MIFSVYNSTLEIELANRLDKFTNTDIVLGSVIYKVDMPVLVESIKVRLVGVFSATTANGENIKKRDVFMKQELQLLRHVEGKSYSLPPNYHNYPFEFNFSDDPKLPPSFSHKTRKNGVVTIEYFLEAYVEKHLSYKPDRSVSKKLIFSPNNKNLSFSTECLLDILDRILPNHTSKIFNLKFNKYSSSHSCVNPQSLQTLALKLSSLFKNMFLKTNSRAPEAAIIELPFIFQVRFPQIFSSRASNITSGRFIPVLSDLSDYISISLLTPADLTRFTNLSNNSITVKDLTIDLMLKTFTKDKLADQRTITLATEELNQRFMLSELEEQTIASTLELKQLCSKTASPEIKIYKLPLLSEVFKCTVPEIYPSFEFCDLRRQHSLSVTMNIVSDGTSKVVKCATNSSIIVMNRCLETEKEYLPAYSV